MAYGYLVRLEKDLERNGMLGRDTLFLHFQDYSLLLLDNVFQTIAYYGINLTTNKKSLCRHIHFSAAK
jgi:hypothetical protein